LFNVSLILHIYTPSLFQVALEKDGCE